MKMRVETPAKINLTLKVGKRRPDGFHPIESIMQTISLFDYLDVEIKKGMGKITLDGSSSEIPYDEKNIVYKAACAFMDESGLKFDVNVYIEKNIPVCAGLAGGSTNAAGMLFGLNKLHNNLSTYCSTIENALALQDLQHIFLSPDLFAPFLCNSRFLQALKKTV